MSYTYVMRARRIVLTLIAIFVVMVSGTSLIRTVRTFYRLDFPVSWVEGGLVVDETYADVAGSPYEPEGLEFAVGRLVLCER